MTSAHHCTRHSTAAPNCSIHQMGVVVVVVVTVVAAVEEVVVVWAVAELPLVVWVERW